MPDQSSSFADKAPAEAVAELVEKQGGRIYGLGLRMCGSPAEAEDLAQETFLLAFRKWHQFEGRSQATTWLYTIAARLCRRRRRRRSGEPATLDSLSDLPSGDDTPSVDLPAEQESPLDEQLRREARERLDAALARLPAHFRLPLVLKDLAELSVAEVAEVLGLKEATVKTRVHRARLALRDELSGGRPERDRDRPDHERQVCLDLLSAKQEALDRGVEFPVGSEELCSRCRALFSSLDLTVDACRRLGADEMPEELRRSILDLTRG